MQNKFSSVQKKRFIIAVSAMMLGLSAAVGSLLLGISVLKVTSHEIQEQMARFYLAKASSLATLSSPDHALSDSTLLVEMNRVWQSSSNLPEDEYICVIDDSSKLIWHSALPQTVGSQIGDNRISNSKLHTTITLGSLVRSSEPYIGDYVSSSGELQIAAFYPISERNWMIGVHRSKRAVENSIEDLVRPQYLGLLIISLGIIPLALGLLYFLMYRGGQFSRGVLKDLVRERILLNGLMDNTPDHIYFKDRDSRFIKINNSQAEYLKLSSPEEAIGKIDYDYFPREHAQLAFETEQSMMKTGEPLIGKEEHHLINNEDRWMSATKWPLQDGEGEIFGTVGISRDITDMVETRKEFEKQSRFLEDVIASLQHPFLVIDANDYSVVLANPAAQNSTFKSQTSCYALSHGKDNPCDSIEHPCPLVITKDTRKPAVVEHIHLDSDGNPTYYEVHSFPIFDDAGEIIQIIEYSLDINDRKSVQDELRKEYQLQAVLFQIARAGQFAKTLEDLCKIIHASLRDVLNTNNFYIAIADTEGEKLSFPFFKDQKDDHPGTIDFGKGMTEYVIGSGKTLLATSDDIVRMDRDGDIILNGTPSKIWLGTPMKIGDKCVGAIVVQSYEDENHFDENDVNLLEFVSSQIATSLIAQQADDKLAVSERLKELMLDIITHDLKNPIALIYSFTQLALAKAPDDNIIEQIHVGSSKLLKVLDNTTVLSQAVSGESIPMEEIDLYQMLNEIVEEFTPLAVEAEMTMELRCESDMKIIANPIIGEIFKNFISNSIKYARSGKKLIIKAVENDSINISVQDYGQTIPEQDRDRVFDRNIQLAESKKRGRGLGLSIVKRIAQAHHAEVWVEPSTPQGNTFCVRIPHQEATKS